jgi:hypothetical protein
MQMFSVRIIEVFQSFTTCMLYVCILIFLRHPISQRYSFQYFPSQNPVKYKNITPLLGKPQSDHFKSLRNGDDEEC